MASGHVYKRGSVWWFKYYRNGVAKAESSGSRKESVARNMLNDRLGRIATGQPILPARVDRVTYLEADDDLRANYKSSGSRNLEEIEYRLLPLGRFFQNYRLAAIDTAVVDQYIAARLGQGRAGATINREVGMLGRLLRLAVRNKKLVVAPTLTRAKEAPPRRGFLSPEQFIRVRAHLAPDLQVAATLGYQLGWRCQSEVLALEGRHVDLKAGRIALDAAMTKTERPRGGRRPAR